MSDKSLALILYAIRELQMSIQYNPELMLRHLNDFYGVAIASGEELFDSLEELAQSLNCEGLSNESR